MLCLPCEICTLVEFLVSLCFEFVHCRAVFISLSLSPSVLLFLLSDVHMMFPFKCSDTVDWATGKSVKSGCWFVGGDDFDWSFVHLIAPVVTITSITLSSDKIQNGDSLVPAESGTPGKWPIKGRDRAQLIELYQWSCESA